MTQIVNLSTKSCPTLSETHIRKLPLKRNCWITVLMLTRWTLLWCYYEQHVIHSRFFSQERHSVPSNKQSSLISVISPYLQNLCDYLCYKPLNNGGENKDNSLTKTLPQPKDLFSNWVSDNAVQQLFGLIVSSHRHLHCVFGLFARFEKNKAGYTANTSRGRVGRADMPVFPLFDSSVTDRPTDRPTNRRADRRTEWVIESRTRDLKDRNNR